MDKDTCGLACRELTDPSSSRSRSAGEFERPSFWSTNSSSSATRREIFMIQISKIANQTKNQEVRNCCPLSKSAFLLFHLVGWMCATGPDFLFQLSPPNHHHLTPCSWCRAAVIVKEGRFSGVNCTGATRPISDLKQVKQHASTSSSRKAG